MGEAHISKVMEVEPGWIDFNGHMNMAYYSVLFDRAADGFFGPMGLGPAYAAGGKFTTYSAEFHICYLRELHLGARVRVHSWLLDHDEKRLHAWQEIHHEEGWIAATGETLALHIDQSGPRVAPMPEEIRARVAEAARRHGRDIWPERAGRAIGITKR